MFDAMWQGLLLILVPYKLLALMVGVVIGTVIAILPGIGAVVALTIILPYLIYMEPVAAVAMMMGVYGVINTADSITAVLLGIPGTGGGAPSIIEGHPMARKGEAARALGASFSASLVGGLMGSVGLGISIPILGVLIKQFGSPEFLMLSLLGIASVAGLGGEQVIKGLISAGLGLFLAGVGGAALTPYLRYTVGISYLHDGFPLPVVALGLFGIVEMIELVLRGTPIGGLARVETGVWAGFRDCFTHIWLVIRCSLLGIYVGLAPGAGSTIAAWIAYGHAAQTGRADGRFGRGDVRGLLAPEAANNACRGGDLVTTLLFGVPGSATCALIMISLMIFGIFPGPDMVGKHLPITWSFVWSLALSTIIGVTICIFLAKPLAKIAVVPIQTLAPMIIIIVVMGAFQATQSWGDLIVLLAFGGLGWIMKETGYGRPPLIVGFVLGGLIERYLGFSLQRYGWTFLGRPWVIVLLVCILAALWVGARVTRKGERVEKGELP